MRGVGIKNQAKYPLHEVTVLDLRIVRKIGVASVQAPRRIVDPARWLVIIRTPASPSSAAAKVF
jgi:hypothetical protein